MSMQDEAHDRERWPTEAYGWYVVFVMCLCSVVAFVDRQIINLLVEDIEEVFRSVKYSGINMSAHQGSPVHQGVVEQTWGTLEFYVTDPDGNTIRFVQR